MPHYHKCLKCHKKFPCTHKFKNAEEEYACKMGRKSICPKCWEKLCRPPDKENKQ